MFGNCIDWAKGSGGREAFVRQSKMHCKNYINYKRSKLMFVIEFPTISIKINVTRCCGLMKQWVLETDSEIRGY